MTVPGFPNFFMLYGPNTNLVINGSILIMVECQVRYAVEAIGAAAPGRPSDDVVPAGRPRALRPRDGGGQRQDGLGRGGRADLVPQRARPRDAELALRPPHLLGPHAASPTWPTTSWPERRGAQPRADRDPRPRPARLRRPGGGLPGGAGHDGAVPRPPGAGARHGDRERSWAGCAAPGTTTPADPAATASSSTATAAASCRARSTTTTSTGPCWPSSSRPGS